MDQQQVIQEEQYDFPYHHIVEFQGEFLQARNMRWGCEYASYLSLILSWLGAMEYRCLLDVGCGDGKFLHELAKTVEAERHLTGVDISERAVAFARAFTPDVTFIAGDVTKDNEVPGTYDVITLIEVFEHIPPEACNGFLAGIARRLAPGGRLIVSVPSSNTPVDPKHYRHFTVETLTQALKPYFRVDRAVYHNRRGRLTKLLFKSMSNKLFLLNATGLRRRAWRFYQRHLAAASPSDGKRVIALARVAQEAT